MTDRPILDIPLDTSAFEAFRAKFDAVRAKTAEMPSAWAEVGKTTASTAQTFDKMADALVRMQEALAGIQQQTEKSEGEQSAASDRWSSIASSARIFSSNIKDASLSLVKWSGLTSLFAGILSAGGLYGISRMAAGVGARRSQAMSYGSSYGEFQSYQTNFARLGNSGGLLAGFNEAMTNAESRGPLYALMGAGADKRLAGKSAAGALAEALPDIKRFVDRTDPRNLEGALHGTGLDRLGVDVNTALTIRRMSPQEIDQIVSGYRSDTGPMGLDPEIAQKWQNFETTLDEAGSEIENHFAVNLVNLTPGLTRLADATSDLVDHMLKDGGPAEKWLARVNKGMVGFADDIGSRETLGRINKFVNGVTDVGKIISQIIAVHGENGNPNASLGGIAPDDAKEGWNHSKSNRYMNWLFGLNSHSRGENQRSRNGGPSAGGGTSRSSAGGLNTAVTPQDADQSTWGPNLGIRAGRSPDLAHVDPKLIEVLGAGAGHLPLGYKVMISEGYNPNGHEPNSMHHRAGQGAIDFVIVGPDGREIPNAGGNDPTGLYTRVHRDMEGELAARYPDLAASHAMGHGADFETKRGSGRKDWMHVDFGGSRGDQSIEKLGPREGEHYGANPGDPDNKLSPVKPLHPHFQGQTNTVHVDDETGSADVHRDTRAVGPMSYGTDFGRFSH